MEKLSIRGKLSLRRWDDFREFILVLDAFGTGLVYMLGTEGLRATPPLIFLQKTPGGFPILAVAMFSIVTMLVLGRFVWPGTHMRRIGHSLGVGVYFLFGFAILMAQLTARAEAGSGWLHLWLIASVHLKGAADLPLPGEIEGDLVDRRRHRRKS